MLSTVNARSFSKSKHFQEVTLSTFEKLKLLTITLSTVNVLIFWKVNDQFVESLQSHMILTMSHWSNGLTSLLPATRVTGSNPLGGTYVKPGFSC
jgi:hypothetical protein